MAAPSSRPSLASTFDALFGPAPGEDLLRDPSADSSALQMVDRERVRTSPQPRETFPAQEIAELACSIAELKEQGGGIGGTGILQPLLVAPIEQGGPPAYRLIAGERRWRAAGEAGLRQVPVIVVPMREETVLLAQLVENLQRRDLPPLEEARSLARLMEAQGLSVRDAAKLLGKPKSYLSDRLALLKMGRDVQAMVSERSDTLIHAREVDAVQDPALRRELIQGVARRELSLSQVRRKVEAASGTHGEVASDEEADADEREPSALPATGARSPSPARPVEVPAPTGLRIPLQEHQERAEETEAAETGADVLELHVRPALALLSEAAWHMAQMKVATEHYGALYSALQEIKSQATWIEAALRGSQEPGRPEGEEQE